VAGRSKNENKRGLRRGRGMSGDRGGCGEGTYEPERDVFRLARKLEESSSGEAGNSSGRTSGEPGIGLFMGGGAKRQETPREVGSPIR
jgi:hypothetical protein